MTQLANQIARSRPSVQGRPRPRFITSLSILEEAQGQSSSFNGLAALFGNPTDQLAFSIFSLLPWLCLHYKHTPFTPVAQACLQARTAALCIFCRQPAKYDFCPSCHVSAVNEHCLLQLFIQLCVRELWSLSTCPLWDCGADLRLLCHQCVINMFLSPEDSHWTSGADLK